MNLRTLLIAAAITAGFVWYTSKSNHALVTVPSWTEAPTVHSAGLSADELNNIDVYKASQPAVVYITSTVIERGLFRDFTSKGIGSGFIISADGQILTNNHVVSGSADLEVTLTDKSRHKAQIVMRIPSDDLALIRIDPQGKKLPVLRLGDSDAVQVGQKVLAIGNPFGFSGTLTTGIISALDRSLQGENGEELEGLLQTDASINQGNSGGPLLDSMGNVIGINTAIIGPSGGSVGIGFAMPINRAKRMLEDFKQGRRPAEPQIGITTTFLEGDWPQALDLPGAAGLLIDRVYRDSPAARAGLRGADRRVRVGNYLLNWGGDYITHVDGKPVKNQDDVQQAARRKHAGESIELTIVRGGKSMKISVTLAALDNTVV
jgi:putative serine protease PepD